MEVLEDVIDLDEPTVKAFGFGIMSTMMTPHFRCSHLGLGVVPGIANVVTFCERRAQVSCHRYGLSQFQRQRQIGFCVHFPFPFSKTVVRQLQSNYCQH